MSYAEDEGYDGYDLYEIDVPGNVRRTARANEAMEQLIMIIINEYPAYDERYKTALAIATEFGIDVEEA